MIRRFRALWVGFALCAVLAALVNMPGAAAQGLPPLKATLFLVDPPADLTYDALSDATPVKIRLRVENVSGAPVRTTEGFHQTEFWRRLYFTDPRGGIITNVAEAITHSDARVGFCLSRQGALQTPTAIPVVPIEVLEDTPQPDGPARFLREFLIDDARRFFDLTRSGRHTAEVRFDLLVFETDGALIGDCDQFPDTTLVDVRGGVPGRREHTIVSNAIEFVIRGIDSTPPTTIAIFDPVPIGEWHRGDVTVRLSAEDDPEGSGVARIVTSTSGAQSGEQTFDGPTGELTIIAEGATTVRFRAVDAAENHEFEQTALVQIDRTPPTVSIAPVAGTFIINAPLTLTVNAADLLSGLRPGSPMTTITPPGGPATAVPSGATVTLPKVGTTIATAVAVDVAGNQATAGASYTVVYNFGGFSAPLAAVDANATCPATCPTFKYGSTVTVAFRLLDHANVPVGTSVATIAVQPLMTTAAAATRFLGAGKYAKSNQFLYDKRRQEYVFDINTRAITRGDWRIQVTLDDGTSRYALMRLQ